MHDLRAVANEILRIAQGEHIQLTPMQIIKLVFFAHGWSLGLRDEPLIKHDAFAWQYGPVIREVYWAFSRFGRSQISEEAADSSGIPYEEDFTDDERSLLRGIVQGYGRFHAFRLSEITHRPGTPWANTFKPGARARIDPALMKSYYQELARRRNENQTESFEPWEELIVSSARNEGRAAPGFNPNAIQELAERVDALEFMLEGREELPRLARELAFFARDRRNELRSLRRYRFTLSAIAILAVGAVAGFLVYEIATGFSTFKDLIKSEYILAAYVAASLAFILGVLLVLLRGVFGAIKDAENAPNLPPQVQEIYDIVKKLGHH